MSTHFVSQDLAAEVTEAFVSHLEDVLQSGRAVSLQQGRLVRARLIIDASGIASGMLKHISEYISLFFSTSCL
jgi:hypothetical protein